MAPPEGGNIKVVVRVRPFNTREIERNAQCIIQMRDGQTTVIPPTGEHKPRGNKAALESSKTFAYDHSYWSFDRNDPQFSGQESVFEDLGKPLLDNAFQGYNNCIFAYGQTGSGKSYSMMGFGSEPGVIPRICKDMFDRIEALQQDKNITCRVEVSYLEIYNERVRDLLNPATKGNLKVREHPSTGPYVEDLAKLVVRSFSEIENLMDEGNKARTVAATNMNETSSRSHAVFTLNLTQKRHDDETKMDMERVAKISLVDLAGSERATSTGATGARLKEGAEINRSLSTLGRVIAALADVSTGKRKNASMIPYRDSVLTWLLKDSLGGNSMTAMIAAISPADINFEETLSTLRYADSAKRIKNHAVVNEDANARMIRELKEELAQLRSKLSGGGAGEPSDGAGEPHYPPGTPLDKQLVTFTYPDGTTRQVSKAEIAEQLSQSEKLYQDLNQTWEQKLQKTEEIHKEREAALEELGISIEKGFVGLSTPKKMPHLVNLSDDPLLAECLVYNLKPGSTTVGNDEMSTIAEIRLKGSKILKEHCIFENLDGIVSVIPNEDAAVMVNGIRVDQSKRLRSGYRIILGDFHIFRFNHPQEARAERAEQGSMLKQSLSAEDNDSSPQASHARSRSSISRQGSERERGGSQSPTIYPANEHDYDWSFARREAATAILGSDQKIANLTDEELDVLFDDLQRVRANRRTRPESLITDREYDSDSVTSYPMRDKYLSTTTLDSHSLDTALTAPSTPPHSEDLERQRFSRDSHRVFSTQRGDLDEETRSTEGPHIISRDANADVAQLEKEYKDLKDAMEKQLQEQKEEYERKIEQMHPPAAKPTGSFEFSSAQIRLAKWSLNKWKQRKYVRMAGLLLQTASVLKEAQILSQQMSQAVVFQFCIIDIGHTMGSSYDLVLNGISDDDDDGLLAATKPCLGIRVVDFKNNAIYSWSIEKLTRRVQLMREMLQYLERPEYLQHFKLDNPFLESCPPQFSRIGEAQVSLAAVFESRVQDFVLDVISPYTFNVVGILKLSLEPSLADAPPSTLKFNVILQEMSGFSEMEGSDVHAQLLVSRISDEEGATTTQLINGFNEGPVAFESLHGMSLPTSSSRDSMLRISIFSKVTSMHLDKLLSWDDMRDSSLKSPKNQSGSRLAEKEFQSGDRHDVFAQVQILELLENGEYEPVEVLQSSSFDVGAYQLHQGLQRRVVINLTHTCGESFPWQDIVLLRVGQIRLLDSAGQVPDLTSSQDEVVLKLLSNPKTVANADGTTNVRLIGQWDSSAHNSLLLDRTTSEKHRVQITLAWDVLSPSLIAPLKFSLETTVQIRSRSYIRAPSVFSQLWNSSRVAHSTSGIFAIYIKQNKVTSTLDLWRLDTKHDYVKGEESLTGWTPRGVSLIRDFISHRKRQTRIAEIETARSMFGKHNLNAQRSREVQETKRLTDEQKKMMERIVEAWQNTPLDPSSYILSKPNIDPPKDGAAFAPIPPQSTPRIKSSATVHYKPKNPTLLKSSNLLMPDPTQSRWVRRYVELRRPFLHIYSVSDGDELNAINLHDSRVDHQPQVVQLLQRSSQHNGPLNVFAIYARQNAYLFATRSEREKLEWILRIDETYFATGDSERF